MLPSDPSHSSGRLFCSASCLRAAESSYLKIEALAPAVSHFFSRCAERGERFPLLAARLMSMRLYRNFLTHTGQAVGPSTGCMPSDSDNGVRPTLQGDALADLRVLCFARVQQPYPPSWQESYAALCPALRHAAHKLSEAQSQDSCDSDKLLHGTSLDDYAAALCRISINAFRVDTVVMPAWGYGAATGPDTLSQLAAAAVLTDEPAAAAPSGGNGGSLCELRSWPERGGTGSAVYLVASLINHSCCPNLDVIFPCNNSVLVSWGACSPSSTDQESSQTSCSQSP